MTYLILADLADRVSFANGADALTALSETRKTHPNAGLVEVVIYPDNALPMKLPIPAELDQAIDAWNLKIAGKGKLKFYKETIRKKSIYVAAYKRWRKAIGTRGYFLWQLVDDILVADDFLQSFILFGHLFRQAKSKEWHSDLLHAGHYKTASGGGNGKMTEADYIRLAGRVSAWKSNHVDGASFTHDLGITPENWEKLRARFNGAHP